MPEIDLDFDSDDELERQLHKLGEAARARCEPTARTLVERAIKEHSNPRVHGTNHSPGASYAPIRSCWSLSTLWWTAKAHFRSLCTHLPRLQKTPETAPFLSIAGSMSVTPRAFRAWASQETSGLFDREVQSTEGLIVRFFCHSRPGYSTVSILESIPTGRITLRVNGRTVSLVQPFNRYRKAVVRTQDITSVLNGQERLSIERVQNDEAPE